MTGGGTREPLAARLTAAFIDEIGENHRVLVEDALALEREPANADRQRSVLRIMHTLKGAARAASVPSVEALCHAMESELAQARATNGALTPAQISLLLASADALADAAEQLRSGKSASEGSVAALLHRMTGSRRMPTATAPLPERKSHAPLVAHTQRFTPVVPELREVAVVPDDVTPDDTADTEKASQTARRTDFVRIGADQLEALSSAAGELLGLAARMEGYPAVIADSRATIATSAAGLAMVTRRLDADVNTLRTLSSRLVRSVRELRQSPFSVAVEMLPRTVRDLTVTLGKTARLVVEGQDVEAERAVLEMIRDPLLHLARNAVDHGLESPGERAATGKDPEGTVRVAASVRGDRLQVTVSDDGRGVDVMAIRRKLAAKGREVPESDHDVALSMFEEGLSTRDDVNAISGRGMGLEIVRDSVEKAGGTVDVAWQTGKGTTITIEVPVSIAITRALIVDVGGFRAAIPSAFVDRVERVSPDRVRTVTGKSVLEGEGRPVRLVSLADRLGEPFQPDAPEVSSLVVIWLSALSRRLVVVVRDVIDERELVLRPVPFGGGGTLVSAAALLPEGDVAIVLDVPALVGQRTAAGTGVEFKRAAQTRAHRILVVDDSITTRSLEASVLGAAGYDVATAVDGMEGWRVVQSGEFDLVVSDVQMPRMDGLELCRKIRASQKLKTLPFILVTSLDQPAEKMQGMEAGADSYITKSSFDQDTLLGTIRQLIGATRKASA